MRVFLTAAILGCFCSGGLAQVVSPLFARGHTVVPEPQQVSLGTNNFTFGSSWQLKLDKGVSTDDIAVEALREDLSTRFHVTLGAAGKLDGILSLRIVPGSVQIGKVMGSPTQEQELKGQAYRIDLHSNSVTITANAATGLFYGAETFIQLLKPNHGTLWLPEGSIEDWPNLQLRAIYWDDDHHLDRVDALKHALRQAAFYKVNGFVIKLDGHFQYKSAPAVVEPNALSPAELQDLTNYGLRYHIQLIPYLDGPAHIAFILKHPEYAKLREFPNLNYEICSTNPKSYKLLEGMYQDLMDANKGVKYFYLSTDEPYYIGMANNSQCNEEDLAKQLGSKGEVLSSFVNKTAGYLHDQERSVIFWRAANWSRNDIQSLSPYVIGSDHGHNADPEFIQRGIRQMIYSSIEGEEDLFPGYFMLPQSELLHARRHPGESSRIDFVSKTVSSDDSPLGANFIGHVVAGWADRGVNPEAFWLGFVMSNAGAWHFGPSNPQEFLSSFYPLFYGSNAVSMNRVYQLMSEQAQTWTDSWERMPSKIQRISAGFRGIFATPLPADDQTLPLPPAPTSDLAYSSTWSQDNARRITLASNAMRGNTELLGLLGENIQRSQFNQYNLEVFLSIANLYRQNLEMIAGIHRMDMDLAAAAQNTSNIEAQNPEKAIAAVDQALDTATSIWRQRNKVLQSSTTTWEKSWFPVVPEANGRRYLNVFDDVKDHLPARTTDMSYLVYREKLLPFETWVNSILAARNKYAKSYNFPIRSYQLSWDDFSVAP